MSHRAPSHQDAGEALAGPNDLAGPADPADPADPIGAYLHQARRHRRSRLRRAALALAAAGVAAGFMVTRMTDIGHAVGFAALAAALLAGAVVVLRAQ